MERKGEWRFFFNLHAKDLKDFSTITFRFNHNEFSIESGLAMNGGLYFEVNLIKTDGINDDIKMESSYLPNIPDGCKVKVYQLQDPIALTKKIVPVILTIKLPGNRSHIINF